MVSRKDQQVMRIVFLVVMMVVMAFFALPAVADSENTQTIPSDIWVKEPGSRIAPGAYPAQDYIGPQTQDVIHFPAGAAILNPDGSQRLASRKFLRMYYGGINPFLLHQVLSAVSFDEGLTWIKEPGIRLSVAPDEYVAYHPSVIRISRDGYRMYFESIQFGMPPRVRSAFSADGLAWVRDPGDRIANAADPDVKIKGRGFDLIEEDEGENELASDEDSGACASRDKYRMYFVRGGDILSAASKDGITWTEEPGIRVSRGAPGALDSASVSHFYVIRLKNKKYKMYYTAADGVTPTLHGNGQGRAILSAGSCDGLSWVKDAGIRIDMGGPGSLDQHGLLQPTVIRLSDGSFRMFYQGGVGFSLRFILSAHADAASEEEDLGSCEE